MTKRLATKLMTLCAGLALAGAACTVNSQDAPSLTGPSELALSFLVTATPDSITQDGVSQSSIVVTAKGPNGQALAGVVFRLDMLVGGVPADYGRLSGKTVVTGTDGRASAVYTAPAAVPAGGNTGYCAPSPFSPFLPGTCVTVSATPIGTGFTAGINSQTVDIHLVPLGVILPPADTPTADFVVTPTPVEVGISTNFDGSLSCGGPVTSGACSSGNVIVSYQWGFGDGASGTGRTTSHKYSAPGTYTVILTVTNDGGKSATKNLTVNVATGAAPTADFSFSPISPVVGQPIFFNAASSRAGVGHTLTSYIWNWGDGSTGNGQTETHSYAANGSYAVTLTVSDDVGQTATVTRTVSVGTNRPTAVLVITKGAGNLITANASGSTAVGGATIADYTFDWGGAPAPTVESGTAQIRTHTYTAPGTYTVILTVTDNAVPARTASVIQSVTVP